MRLTFPLLSSDNRTAVWFMTAVMGKELFPGLMSISGTVAMPTTPAVAVERERVTFPWSRIN